jgi:hypothetical protein
LYAAAIQFNDPDPAYWVLVYASTAMVAIAAAAGRLRPFWVGAVIGGVVAGLALTMDGFIEFLQHGDYANIMGDMASSTFVEESREFLGLTLALTLLIYYSIRHPY